MSDGFDYARYQQYLSMAAEDLGLVHVRSLQAARGRWGIRRLSPSEFKRLSSRATQEPGVCERWRQRLTRGYFADRSRLEDEIEDGFAQVPTEDGPSGACEEAA